MIDSDIVEIAQLIYKRWSEAATLLQHCKAEKFDKTEPDWELGHEYRLESAKAEESHWLELKQRFLDKYRDVINKAYGL